MFRNLQPSLWLFSEYFFWQPAAADLDYLDVSVSARTDYSCSIEVTVMPLSPALELDTPREFNSAPRTLRKCIHRVGLIKVYFLLRTCNRHAIKPSKQVMNMLTVIASLLALRIPS